MRVLLRSNDQELAKSCREILAELFGDDWYLAVGTAGQNTSEFDLYIWDLNPGDTHVPRELDRTKLKKHFFLLHRTALAEFQRAICAADVNILLKPVTRATLRAFLVGANGENVGQPGGGPGSVGTLRGERDDMLQFLIQANLKLQEYDQERTNFLARSVHDFRAPLTAINGYCGLLLEEELGPLTADQREILERMQRSGSRLTRIANAMYQLSVGQNIQQPLNLEDSDIRDCVDQALHEVAPFLENKHLSVTVDIRLPPERLLFEKAKMEETIINLLDNACKFTPREGTIDIRGYPFFWERRTGRPAALDPSLDRRSRSVNAPNSFRLDVHDSGPGIPADSSEKVFEEYTSYSGGQDRSGAGLGLAICRMILQQHQGRVWAENGAPGAMFSFVIPLHPNGTCVSRGPDGNGTRPVPHRMGGR